MHADAAGADIFADGIRIIISVNGVGSAVCPSYFQSEPSVPQWISLISAPDIFLIIRPVFNFIGYAEFSFRCCMFRFSCGNAEGFNNLSFLKVGKLISAFVDNDQLIWHRLNRKGEHEESSKKHKGQQNLFHVVDTPKYFIRKL